MSPWPVACSFLLQTDSDIKCDCVDSCLRPWRCLRVSVYSSCPWLCVCIRLSLDELRWISGQAMIALRLRLDAWMDGCLPSASVKRLRKIFCRKDIFLIARKLELTKLVNDYIITTIVGDKVLWDSSGRTHFRRRWARWLMSVPRSLLAFKESLFNSTPFDFRRRNWELDDVRISARTPFFHSCDIFQQVLHIR